MINIISKLGIIASIVFIITTSPVVIQSYAIKGDLAYCTTLQEIIKMDKAGIGPNGYPLKVNMTPASTLDYKIYCEPTGIHNITQNELIQVTNTLNDLQDSITPQPLDSPDN